MARSSSFMGPVARSPGGFFIRSSVLGDSCVMQSLPDITEALRPPQVYEIALKHVRASRFTDAELIYTPSQIALASLSLASPLLSEKWMDSKMPPDSVAARSYRQSLECSSSAIGDMILRDAQPPDVETAREVDRCLKLCKNPEKVVGSKAYLARQAVEERRAEEKRNKKARDVHKITEGDDPFGCELVEGSKGPHDIDEDD